MSIIEKIYSDAFRDGVDYAIERLYSEKEEKEKIERLSTQQKLALATAGVGLLGLGGYLLHKRIKPISNSNTPNKSRQISTAPKRNNDNAPKPKSNNKSNSDGKDVYVNVKGGDLSYVDKNGNKLTRDEAMGNKNNRLVFK